ncbi:MAG: hypothetical protein ACOYOV_06000 [Bacteroidales bacterium]
MTFFTKTFITGYLILSSVSFPFLLRSQIIYTETGNSPQTLRFDAYNVTEKTYNTKMTGSSYIYDDWKLSDIKMTSDSGIMQNLMIKIDVLYNIIEIKKDEEIKILPANQTILVKLKEKNEVFITKNALGDFLLNGFSKIIYNEKTSLLCNYSAKVKEAKYNEALAVGNRDDELIIVKNYYFFINNELSLVERNKKKFLKSFAYNPNIQEFIKEKNISPKNEDDLVILLKFIDSIL